VTATNDLCTRHGDKMLGHANQTPSRVEQEAEIDPRTRSAAGKVHARGFPIIGPGSLVGTIIGTDPVQALLEKAEAMGW
jgi:hypothetical protein